MDDDDLTGVKILLGVIVAFLFSAYMSWGQFKYWAFAETATARVTRTFETVEPGRRGRKIPKLAVEF